MTTPAHAPVLVVPDPAYGESGELDASAAELIGAASAIGVPVALTLTPAHAAELGRSGASRVLSAEGASLVDATAAAFEELHPAAVVFSHSVRGRDAAARFAARRGLALLADVVGVRRDAEGVITDHSNYGGAFTTVAAATHSAPVITVRRGAIETRATAAEPAVEELLVMASGARVAKVTEVVDVERTSPRPDLVTADKVVAGGVSLGDADNFEELVGGLADTLGAAVGATRSAVDEGQVPYEAQIGQTGVLVSPKLYIGVGISGAVQHVVGMQTADTIVAINNDPDAPIFELADFGVVGDIFDVVPALISEITKRAHQSVRER
ncbi:Electron transfer flavoprotein subunit alpha [Corynebacterium capitovis DSM 44611]|uniref:electron transfer flavoprotein subunit alpha/FixB family protein n=1 Tax=Corynebacterium capitovis TaxID=131081 RepID=UPI000367A68C|nr:electron transfer flavoprotein subunit alpha/FixB family protein [Corynebacterium capitovis]WKD57163.1 Electron transfer flavoprotein subunit alpha [Corynebacterium capitovis DSM 44611]